MDWIMILPEKLEQLFDEAIKEYEEDKRMPYVTSIERRAIRRGLQQGLERGLEQGLEQGITRGALQNAQENVLEILRIRFGAVPKQVIDEIMSLTNLARLKLVQAGASNPVVVMLSFQCPAWHNLDKKHRTCHAERSEASTQ
jgi:flagellar biosynthesis/type III secretory pathway protein FliH